MDGTRFDTLARALTRAGTRRAALTVVLGGGALATLGLGTTEAKKKQCPPCKKRKQGKCKVKKPDGTLCSGGTCQGGRCLGAPPSCGDGIKNGSETDIDCGGTCPRCANGQSCATQNDCAGAFCSGGTCKACSSGPCGGDPLCPCGGDAEGLCYCRQPATGGSNVCAQSGTTGGAVQSCTECPAGTMCSLAGAPQQPFCFKLCGAS